MTETDGDRIGDERTALVVDDESQLADLFATWLAPDWTTETAYDGSEALEKVDASVDVVLLDRRMPGRSEYESTIRDYYALVSKKALLESEKGDRELEDSNEYRKLRERIDGLERRLDETVDELSTHDDFVDAFEELRSDH